MVDNHDLLILLADYGQTCEDAGWHDPILSEIHYNPSTQQGSDSDHEFLELTNPNPSTFMWADGPSPTASTVHFPRTRGSKPEAIWWSPTILACWTPRCPTLRLSWAGQVHLAFTTVEKP